MLGALSPAFLDSSESKDTTAEVRWWIRHAVSDEGRARRNESDAGGDEGTLDDAMTPGAISPTPAKAGCCALCTLFNRLSFGVEHS
jgi:hypothetical protein